MSYTIPDSFTREITSCITHDIPKEALIAAINSQYASAASLARKKALNDILTSINAYENKFNTTFTYTAGTANPSLGKLIKSEESGTISSWLRANNIN